MSTPNYQELVENLSDWVWEVDSQGIYTYCSPKVKDFLGYDVSEVVGKTPFDFMRKDEVERVGKIFGEYVAKQENFFQLENINIHKSGHEVVLETSGIALYDDEGTWYGYRGIDRDITQTKKLEEAAKKELNDNLARLKAAQRLAKLGWFERDFMTGKIICSDEIYTIFGIAAEKKIINISELHGYIHPDDLSLVREGELKFASGEKSFDVIHRIIKGNGSIAFIKVTVDVIDYDDSGKSRRGLISVLDVTEQKENEKKIYEASEANRKTESMMLYQSRLAQMGEMMSMIAHQWRQPLATISAITGNIQLKYALHSLEEDPFISEQIFKIEDQVNFLSQTINDFRNFFHKETQSESFKISDAIAKSLAIIEDSLKAHNIEVKKSIDDTLVVNTYENEFRHVLLNLFKNAEDIITEREIMKGRIEIECYKEGESIYLDVIDNGGGIDDDKIEKVFEPYFTTKSSLNGTGLGLYMSKMIIEKHCKGHLKASTTEGGARFSIILDASIAS